MLITDQILDNNPIEELTSVLDSMYPLQEQIDLALKRFIADGDDPRGLPCVRKPIAESWIRSHNYGVAMDIDPATKKVNATTLKHVLRDNQSLIDAAAPILHKDLAFVRRYSSLSVCLLDCHGTSLLPLTGGKTFNSIDRIGVDLSEETVGTSAHSLSIFLDKPMLLTAPENYNQTLRDVSATISVPIHDAQGRLSGVLIFAYNRHNDIYLVNRDLLIGIITLQFSLVEKIERALSTAPSHRQKYTLFNSVRLLTDDSLIAVNNQGAIQNMTGGAEKLVGGSSNQFTGKSVSELFTEGQQLRNALGSYRPTEDFPASIRGNGTGKMCSIRVVPVNDVQDGISHFIRIKPSSESSLRNLHSLYTFEDIIGHSAEITAAKQLAQKFANIPRNILLLGESGTGKELFAHSIHSCSRPRGPFIAINCASLPKGLIESEFFGYEAGSFTGADRKGRAGKFEMADHGTLYLDEIGDMPLEFQPILLRVLEEKRVMRIGGNHYIPTNFRVIAATNKDLRELISRNQFREDLYYRLSSLKLSIPSLKARNQDIPLLIRHFISGQCQEFNLPQPDIEPAAYKALLCYDWPGNIRELQNVLCIGLSIAEDGVIRLSDLPPEIVNGSPSRHSDKGTQTICQAEQQAILQAMRNAGYNIKKAADALGISRSTLYQKLNKYNISTSPD